MSDHDFSLGVVRFIEKNVHSAVSGQDTQSTTDNHEAARAAFDATVQDLTTAFPPPTPDLKNISAPSKIEAAQDQVGILNQQIRSFPATPAPQEKTQHSAPQLGPAATEKIDPGAPIVSTALGTSLGGPTSNAWEEE